MKYLKSTTQKSYVFNGRHIPECVTKDNAVLTLNDSEYAELEKLPVVKALINSGAIIVMDKAPANPDEQVKSLTNKSAEQALQITRLAERVRELEAQLKESGNGTEVETLTAALETANAETQEWKAKFEQLKKEAEEEIARLTSSKDE